MRSKYFKRFVLIPHWIAATHLSPEVKDGEVQCCPRFDTKATICFLLWPKAESTHDTASTVEVIGNERLCSALVFFQMARCQLEPAQDMPPYLDIDEGWRRIVRDKKRRQKEKEEKKKVNKHLIENHWRTLGM